MSTAALTRLEACHEALIGALDAQDLDAVETSVAALRDAVAEVRAIGVWHEGPDTLSRARRVAQLAQAASVRVNFLTDRNRGRLELLSAVRGEPAPAAYGRSGRAG